MSRTAYPFHSNDISQLARALCKQWAEQSAAPSHLQMLNMLARAVGFQNFQHFRDDAAAQLAAAQPAITPADVLASSKKQAAPSNVQRLLRHFDAQGRLIRWPNKFSEQLPCLWPIWARIPARRTLSEKEVNQFIQLGEAIGDHVLLRRELVNYKLIERTLDGREYRRLEQAPPEDLLPLLREVMQRGVQ